MGNTGGLPYAIEELNQALAGAIGRPRTVLDVGCGTGINGAFARARGAHVTGIELDEQQARVARGRLDEVLELDITSDEALRSLEGRSFDLVLFGDVLEHVPDPLSVLQRFASLLVDGGHALVSLPNVAAWPVRLGLMRGRFRYESSGILDRTHLRFFTRATASELCEAAGLEVMRVELNPMLVRAARDVVASRVLGHAGAGDGQPTNLTELASYRAYLKVVRPLEAAFARISPGLFAFQNVIVTRKAPAHRKLSLTVGMLSYDEEPNVAKMIDQIRAVVPDADILMVDSSGDRTPDIARERGVTVLRQLPPRGHGPAMELLMTEASKRTDALIYLDCDFTYPVEHITRIRALLEGGADVVNATRTRSKPDAMPLPNYVANRVFAATARAVNGVPTTDVHSGMRGYRSSVIRAFAFDGSGDALPLDTLILPARSGYRIVEYPIPYDERVGFSKLAKLRGTAWTFIRVARCIGKGERPTRYEVL
jgi:2-polyprenyl-3-methyl-5-hydroxy-6-metoxy-1,4-benzoquinol methylase